MKIFFDLTTLQHWKGHPTGIQRVIQEVSRALSEKNTGVISGVLHEDLSFRSESQHQSGNHEKLLPAKGDLILTMGSNWDFPDHQSRLLTVKQQGVRLGILYHDTIPVLFPYFYGPGFAELYTGWLKQSLAATDVVFANSRNTLRDVEAFAVKNQISLPPIRKVLRFGDRLPVAKNGSGAINPELTQKYFEPYALSVGTLEIRKNQIILIQAYRYLIEEKGLKLPKLYLVGRQGFLDNMLGYQIEKDQVLNGAVQVLQGVSDEELEFLYQKAQFTLYPSIYEGWGLPVSESLAAGVPCVTSGVSSMLEISPSLTRFAHPLKMEEWANHIMELSQNSEMRNSEARKIQNSYIPTAWSSTAEQVVGACRELCL